MYADSEGVVPLWEAMVGGHESVIQLLVDNGANINSGDVGHFACTAAELKNLNLLKQIVHYGGDVTQPNNTGNTALHAAVCEENIEMVKFLLDQGADIDRTNDHGWTPRDLADQQGHEDIKALFESCKEHKSQSTIGISEERHGIRFLGKFKSDPSIFPLPQGGSSPAADGSWGHNRPRRRTNKFHNSLFGIMSAAHTGERDMLLSVNVTKSARSGEGYPARVRISCPEKGDRAGKLMLLPESFQELLEIGAKKFGISHAKVQTEDGAEIDAIELIRDGDHLVFVSDG